MYKLCVMFVCCVMYCSVICVLFCVLRQCVDVFLLMCVLCAMFALCVFLCGPLCLWVLCHV